MSAIGPCLWCKSAMLPYSVNASEHYLRCSNAFKCDAQGPTRPTPDEAITAWNRLATPDPAEVRGRIRWGDATVSGTTSGFLGPYGIGAYFRDGGRWVAVPPMAAITNHPTEAAARAALVGAVREAIGGTD